MLALRTPVRGRGLASARHLACVPPSGTEAVTCCLSPLPRLPPAAVGLLRLPARGTSGAKLLAPPTTKGPVPAPRSSGILSELAAEIEEQEQSQHWVRGFCEKAQKCGDARRLTTVLLRLPRQLALGRGKPQLSAWPAKIRIMSAGDLNLRGLEITFSLATAVVPGSGIANLKDFTKLLMHGCLNTT